ncbi:SO_0444 family Cu/Zn efflux transporter [Shewanella sedimentimangrovi]|uniref:SO_0444 family Cu/Zn efflux transporter n=1 Tax=Shewanella sedimentimangrovi TaxID=2814293 RepID=A0ABX7R1F1_9GAMM|nr:SO_0444 family Cu/Zn efflux transporter [Shewanella sedimentimangrovi]QSX37634.1 SO_0444 family Cu/Zn efflux transporter [Shewanella sedimentimangrovi]
MLLTNFLHLFLESAPWLLLGLILAGLLKVFVPMEWMQRQLGGHGFKATVKAALLGAPLPLCSCGVIPAAVGLRRSGASKAATTSFLVSTPETGVDSVTVSYVLLGPFMAIVRPIAAVTSAIVAGMLVGRDDDAVQSATPKATADGCAGDKVPAASSSRFTPMMAAPATLAPLAAASFKPQAKAQTDSCCAPKAETSSSCAPKVESCCDNAPKAESCCDSSAAVAVSSCCAGESTATSTSCCDSGSAVKEETSVPAKVVRGLQYAATDLVSDTALWLLVGLFFAALVQTYVPADYLAQWGNGILAMLVMVLVSVPMYICATASTPIAAGLLLAGVSPGAVLVFMMAGPATNIATLGVVTKELGKRALYGYLGGVLGVALVAGMLVNLLVDEFGFEVAPQIGAEHAMLSPALVAISGLLLAALMGRALWQKLPRRKKAAGDCCS